MRRRVLVVVKTYPTPSSRHQETVCTAGITDDGEWVRLYPIRYRYLRQNQQFSKFDWIEADLRPARRDGRPESHNVESETIRVVDTIPPGEDWAERMRWLRTGLAVSVESLRRDQAARNRSLGLVRPVAPKFLIKPDPQPSWTIEELDKLKRDEPQLFDEIASEGRKPILEKVPYHFVYQFHDDVPECRGHEMRVLDWEVHQLYRRYQQAPFERMSEKVRAKYQDEFVGRRDLHFVLGTLADHPATWTIIGVVPAARSEQLSLDFD
jgi:hypothetical protein